VARPQSGFATPYRNLKDWFTIDELEVDKCQNNPAINFQPGESALEMNQKNPLTGEERC